MLIEQSSVFWKGGRVSNILKKVYSHLYFEKGIGMEG